MKENKQLSPKNVIDAIHQEVDEIFLDLTDPDEKEERASTPETEDQATQENPENMAFYLEEEASTDAKKPSDTQAGQQEDNRNIMQGSEPSLGTPAPRYRPPIFLEPTKENLYEVIEHCLIDPENQPPQPIMGIERVEKAGGNSTVLMRGGITTVCGKPKSCKTKFCAMLVAACLNQNVYNGVLRSFFCDAEEEVIYFDNEQSHYDATCLYHNVQRILGEGGKIKNFSMYALRRYNYRQRLMIIEGVVTDPTRNIEIVFLDGFRDVISDPNNAEESNAVINMLMRWSVEYNISIVVVIHQNKVDSNVRGHAGTELVNKSDTVIVVEREDEVCEVRSMVSRGRNITPFYFKLTEEGTPFIIEPTAKSEGKNVKEEAGQDVAPESITDAVHQEVLGEVYAGFSNGFIPGWTDLIKALQKEFSKRSISVGENKLRAFVAFYLREKMLQKTPVAGRSYGGYQLSKA